MKIPVIKKLAEAHSLEELMAAEARDAKTTRKQRRAEKRRQKEG